MLATLKRLTLNLLRLDPSQRKGSLKTRRLIANTSDDYRAELLGTQMRMLGFMRWPWLSLPALAASDRG
ncbi:hypothetical protein GCM10027514_25060 [Azotobacter armeniacus]